MNCANPECFCDFFNNAGGTLWLKELELAPEQSSESEDNGFPMRTRPMKYFWLCAACNEKFVLSQWTSEGVILLPRRSDVSFGTVKPAGAQDRKPPQLAKASSSVEGTIQAMA
jgi:hypothetical protein